MDQDRKGIVFLTDKIGCDLAATTKCGVRSSIRVVTRQGKIGIGHIARVEIYKVSPCGNDLAVRLQGYAERVTTFAGKVVVTIRRPQRKDRAIHFVL